MTYKAVLVNFRTPGDSEIKIFYREAETRALIENLDIFVSCRLTYTMKEENNNPSVLGKGQIEEVRDAIIVHSADEVIFDTFLKPNAEKNLENYLGVPVSDREALILAIFLKNAHTREAKLQLEKAEAIYLKPRLINREQNLSQQRGGVRGAKGEGEKKLELERRKIDERIIILDREIEKIKRQRKVQNKGRKRNSIFTFALLGYTNSGKSTILNTLTKSNVLAQDRLFATLDTTTRTLFLPNRHKVLLSDTVGFISNLPHSLIDAFSSTLEEALNSDAIILVTDASHLDVMGAFDTTRKTLTELGAWDRVRLIVINKIDECENDIAVAYIKNQRIPTVLTSFKNGVGIHEMLEKMESIAAEEYLVKRIALPLSSAMSYGLYKKGYVISEEYKDDKAEFLIRIPLWEEKTYSPFFLDSK